MATAVLPPNYIQISDASDALFDVFLEATSIPTMPDRNDKEGWTTWYLAHGAEYGDTQEKALLRLNASIADGDIVPRVIVLKPDGTVGEQILPRSYWELGADRRGGMCTLSIARGTVLGTLLDGAARSLDGKPVAFKEADWGRWLDRFRRAFDDRTAQVALAASAPFWSAVQVAVWIATRDIGDVSRVGWKAIVEGTTSAGLSDRSIPMALIRIGMEARYAQIVGAAVDKDGALPPPAPVPNVPAEIVNALRRGELSASGLRFDAGAPAEIPTLSWAHFDLHDHSRFGTIAARYPYPSGDTEWWSDLQFRQRDVRRLWPAMGAGIAGPTSKPRGKYSGSGLKERFGEWAEGEKAAGRRITHSRACAAMAVAMTGSIPRDSIRALVRALPDEQRLPRGRPPTRKIAGN